jgi:hypothetical protein
MALSAQSKADIIFQLGWPAKSLIVGSTDYSKILADRLDNLTTEIENNILDWMDKILALDTAIADAVCRLSAKRVGDIETNPEELRELRREKLRLLRELSDMLDIEIMRSGSGVNASICV